MGLDNVIINVVDGGLGNIAPSADGMAGLIISTNDVFGDDPVKVFSAKEARTVFDLGGEDGGFGHAAYAHIDDFYEQAGDGTPLWLYATNGLSDYESYFETDGYAEILFAAAEANGDSIRLLGIALNRDSAYVPHFTNGIDDQLLGVLRIADTWAKAKAAAYRYCHVLLDGGKLGNNATGAPTVWANTAENLRDVGGVDGPAGQYVNVVAATSKRVRSAINGSNQATTAVGLMLGRLAAGAVSDDTSMVSAGPASTEEMYIGYQQNGINNMVPASLYTEAQLNALFDKGYCVVRSFPTRKGWYWAGAMTCAQPTSDYTRTPMVRLVEKARQLAYDKLVERLSAKSPSDATTGKLSRAYGKAVEQDVNNALELALVTPGDATAVRLRIDAANSGGASGAVAAMLEIVPLNYNRTITVQLGLTPTLS